MEIEGNVWYKRHTGSCSGREPDGNRTSEMKFKKLIFPALLIIFHIAPLEARSARISHMSIQDNEGDLYLSFSISGAFTEEMNELIHSGKKVIFTHKVEIFKRRTLWFDKTLKKLLITSTVEYDNLTKQYHLKREVQGNEVVEKVTDLESEMRRFMTHFEKLALIHRNELPEVKKIIARVKSKLKNDFVFLFIPWDFNTNAEELKIPVRHAPHAERVKGK